jgi:hypothetical protein
LQQLLNIVAYHQVTNAMKKPEQYRRGLTTLSLLLACIAGVANISCALAESDADSSNEAILKALAAKQKNLTRLKHTYTYAEREVQRTHDPDGKLAHEDVNLYQIHFVNDHSIQRLVKKNDKPLAGDDLAAEDERVQKETANAHNSPGPDNTVENVLNFTKVTDVKHVSYHGTKALEIDFQPREDAATKDRAEELFSRLTGQLYVDEDSGDLLRLDSKLTSPLRVLGGVAGAVEIGSYLVIDTVMVNNEVRIASKEKRRLIVRKLLARTDTEYEISYYDYKKDTK